MPAFAGMTAIQLTTYFLLIAYMNDTAKQTEEKTLYSPIAFGEARALGRSLLARALRAARGFDGSDEAYEGLYKIDAWITQTRGATTLPRDDMERSLTGYIRGTTKHRGLTISDLLQLAADVFDRKLAANKVAFDVEETGFCFVPSNGKTGIITGSGAGVEPPVFEDRFNSIIKILNQHGISTNDTKIKNGTLPKDMVRQRPYRLIQIPRLNREIAVCDQVGFASFVGQGIKGPLHWATYNNKQLEAQADVTRVEHRTGWTDRLIAALFEDNVLGAKARTRAEKNSERGYPLTEDLILIKALEHALEHKGKLPHQHSDEVGGMPGQNWNTWEQALRTCGRGLKRENCTGLTQLFQIYGLKIGKIENNQLIKESCARIQMGLPHGLTDDKDDLSVLTEDRIIHKALEYAAKDREGKLPTHKSGEIDGLPGQNWCNWNSCLRTRSRGLIRENCRGIAHLFQIYGLKIWDADNKPLIDESVARIKAGQPHGLTDDKEHWSALTEDFIIETALKYAAKNNGKLPRPTSGAIDGLPEQTWNKWNASIELNLRSLGRENCKGLSHLFQIYGLMIGKTDNKPLISEAVARIQTGQPHGLTDDKEHLTVLTEDKITGTALAYAAKHEWQLPFGKSGEIDGMPGQNWSAWDQAIRNRSRGLTREGCKGLLHIFQIYGLKDDARQGLTDVIKQSWERLQATGHHGLVPREDEAARPEVGTGAKPAGTAECG